MWPGWATGGATLASWQFGGGVAELSAAGLLLCGALLSVGPVVYRTVERIQLLLVLCIALGMVYLVARLVSTADVAALAAGALQVGTRARGRPLAGPAGGSGLRRGPAAP